MKPKKIISLLLVLVLTLTACSSRTVPEDSSDASDPTQENANHISHVSATGSTDYTTFIDMCIPNIISVLGEDYGVRIDAILMNYIIVYKLDGDDNRVEFETTAMSDDALSIDEVITDSAIISDTISFYGTVDITGTGLLSSMDIDEAISWCKENNYIYESGSGDNGLETWTYLRINYKGIEVYYEWKDDSIPVVRVISSSYGAPPTETLENQTPGYDPGTGDSIEVSPYDNMSKFEYITMVHQNGSPRNDDILRDIYQYIGVATGISGQVTWTSGIGDGPMKLLVKVDSYSFFANNWANDTFNEFYVSCVSDYHLPILEGDKIAVYGEIYGPDQYTITQNGIQKTKDCYGITVRHYDISGHEGVLGGGYTRTELTKEEKAYWFNHNYKLYGSSVDDSTTQNAKEVYLTETTFNNHPYSIISIMEFPVDGFIVLTIAYESPVFVTYDYSRPLTVTRWLRLYYDGKMSFGEGKFSDGETTGDFNNMPGTSKDYSYEGNIPKDYIAYGYKRADLIT
nr:hypothetical protein [uncultured Oscillibacter sp.]